MLGSVTDAIRLRFVRPINRGSTRSGDGSPATQWTVVFTMAAARVCARMSIAQRHSLVVRAAQETQPTLVPRRPGPVGVVPVADRAETVVISW
jgi:hypothetical protein